MPSLRPTIDVRTSCERFATRIDWLDSRHSFSFGMHYDPANTHFGLLLVSNDDIVQPETGFSTHPHRDMEIVTWVLEGELEHQDSEGHTGLIHPGLAQRMSAGTGIWHSEMNATQGGPVHFVQMWVVPDTEKVRPEYMELDINSQLDRGGLVPVASGRGHDAAISIRQDGAALWAGRLKPREALTLPDAPFMHVYVARETVELEGAGRLQRGDAARVTAMPGLSLTAGDAGAEVLVWEMHGRIGS
jgi:redox-sensitive bicupin YhaK (pirin superfamily)